MHWLDRLLDRAELPLLGITGLAVTMYLMELQSFWIAHGLELEYWRLMLCFDLLFVADFLLKLIFRRRVYIQSPWFFIDLLAALPLLSTLAFAPTLSEGIRVMRGFRFFRMLRSFRVLRTLRFFKLLTPFDGFGEYQASDKFERILFVATLIYSTVFLSIILSLYAGTESEEALQAAQNIEFYLVLGSLLGMTLILGVVRFQLQELASWQFRSLLNIALPSQVATHLMRYPEAYDRTVRMPATVVFCDLKGFTQTVERLEGDLSTLKAHLEQAMQVITTAHQSQDLIIDKFIGDAIMSFRGGDLVDGNPGEHAYRVVRASLDSAAALRALKDPYFNEVKIGGASSEAALIGAFGTRSRLSYTILGDRVNLAARLEAAVSQWGTSNLFCERTRRLTEGRPDLCWRRAGKLRVPGKQEVLDVYEVFDVDELPSEEWIEVFHNGLAAFEQRDFRRALEEFRCADALRGADSLSCRYQQRCEELIRGGCEEGWAPVFESEK